MADDCEMVPLPPLPALTATLKSPILDPQRLIASLVDALFAYAVISRLYSGEPGLGTALEASKVVLDVSRVLGAQDARDVHAHANVDAVIEHVAAAAVKHPTYFMTSSRATMLLADVACLLESPTFALRALEHLRSILVLGASPGGQQPSMVVVLTPRAAQQHQIQRKKSFVAAKHVLALQGIAHWASHHEDGERNVRSACLTIQSALGNEVAVWHGAEEDDDQFGEWGTLRISPM
ncbi:hypothetical protein BC828DRAFT_373935 [Blastocladiella britannica]|nr:hypothetical protein BC828DRAFT_373935 [Blastocladiella britannica]